MRDVALRRLEPERNMARFYVIGVQPTLFGELAVVRRWGRIGSYGRSQETWFQDSSGAAVCAARIEKAKRRRGYGDAAC